MYKSDFVDIKPISVNSCFQGRRFRTTEFKKWQEAVIYSLPKKLSNINKTSERITMVITLYFKKPTMMDLDNYAKAIIDCVVKKGIIKDDRYIFDLNIKKRKYDEEGFQVEIY
ncbi:MAG: RusA family crossover junction endodeoxyribonuclease [Candidatus Berkelbacteria bacterium]|nr:RusA family crossover junction endodeoxyribonuclease [Candidatus Berkelbacteria bacterium]